MIDRNDIFDEVKDNLALWCGGDCAGADLAAVAGTAITNKLFAISVLPGVVSELWPWIENTNIKIITRFIVDQDINDIFMSDFTSRVSAVFREGANGAIVFVHMPDLVTFTSELMCIRDDLFFNKTLSIGLDIGEIDSYDWENVFQVLQSIRADSVTLVLSQDDGDKSDFIGRIYAMLNANMGDWNGALHFILGPNIARIDQVFRLTERLRFNMKSKMLFWVNDK